MAPVFPLVPPPGCGKTTLDLVAGPIATVSRFVDAAMEDEVWLSFDNERLHLFDATTEQALPVVT